jgi:hypothetical protein
MKDNKSTFHRTSLSRQRSRPAKMPVPANRQPMAATSCTQSTTSHCGALALLLLIVLVSTSCTFECIKPSPPMKAALKSFHGRYVTAMGEEDGWELTQDTELSGCGWFTLHHLANGQVALVTCHDRYVTAPKSGTERPDWMLEQEPEMGDCGQFDLYELGNNRVAFRTCAGRFFTAGNDTWDPPWSVGAATEILLDWETFTVVQQ